MIVSDILAAVESVVKKDFRSSEPAALLQSDALLWLKEGMDIIQDQLRDYVGLDTTAAVNAQVEYAFPADLFGDIDGILAITVNGLGLDRAFWPEVLRENRAAPLTLSGKTVPSVFLKKDTDKYAILPAPVTGALGKEVWYLKDPALLTAVGDTIPRYYASGHKQPLTDYLISRALDAINGPGLGEKYFERFMLSINAKKAVKFNRSSQEDVANREDMNNI